MDVFSIIVLVGFIGACLLAATIGATYRPGDWYERLAKPRWRPPNWVFPPAWTVLYLTIAVSGWLVWRTSGFAGAALPLAIYLVQLVLNAAWSPIFFGMRRPDLAFMEIVYTVVLHRRHDSDFPSPQCSGCLAAAALSGLGHFCCGAQLHNLAHESRVSLQRER